jgi:Ca-activated chloride channel family protein
MTPDERDIRLTAYALDDPGVTPEERLEIEAALKTDPAVRKAFMEIRELSRHLAAGLAAEQAAQPAEPPVTIPSTVADAAKPKSGRWAINLAAAAAVIAVGVGLYAVAPFDPSVREAAAPQTEPDALGNREFAAAGRPDLNERAEAAASSAELQSSASETLAANELRFRERFDVAGSAPPRPPIAVPGAMPGGPGILGAAGLNNPMMPSSDLPHSPMKSLHLGGYVKPADPAQNFAPADFTEPFPGREPSANDRYPQLVENPFIVVEGQAALSTFGADVDTASYAIVRKYLTSGQLPPPNAVRLEEMVNYFPYQDPPPDNDDPFAVTVELAECPWQPKHRLARIGLKAKPILNDQRPSSNLVFLIDVSGSMAPPNRLPLVKASLRLLVDQLGENDRVAMVVYAGTTGLVLESTPASNKGVILDAINRLEAGGSTYGSGGIQQAYEVAAANFIKGGTNRVILCTDGDWNVGTTSTEELVKLIEEKRKTGVFLSVFGFGMGNLRDEMMVKLAGAGNGNYGYIDTLKEAHKALVEQIGGTLVTVAKDVKLQVEFNPAVVGAYRLLGYEKRLLATQDFHDDTKDAGEMGAGHVVTALYELVPAGTTLPKPAASEELRYQSPASEAAPKPAAAKLAPDDPKAKEAFVVKMRHKKPDSDTSTYRELPVVDTGKGYADASEDFRFAAAVASFAMLLRDSPHKGNATFAAVLELADAARSFDPSGYRAEFLDLVRRAQALASKP